MPRNSARQPILHAQTRDKRRRELEEEIKRRGQMANRIRGVEEPSRGHGGAEGGPMMKIAHNLSYKDEANLGAMSVIALFSFIEFLLLFKRIEKLEEAYNTALQYGLAYTDQEIYDFDRQTGQLNFDKVLKGDQITDEAILRNNLVPPPRPEQAFSIVFGHFIRDMYNDDWLTPEQKLLIYGNQEDGKRAKYGNEGGNVAEQQAILGKRRPN